MTLNIQPPAKGEPLRASWAGEVTRVLNAFPDKVGAPSRNGRQFPACDLSLFRLGYGKATVDAGNGETATETHLFLRDCWFMHDGDCLVPVNASSATADFGSVDVDSMYGLIALKVYFGPNSGNYAVGTGEIVAIAGQTLLGAMAAADFHNGAYRLFPLWFRDVDNGFTVDLRQTMQLDRPRQPWVWNGGSFDNAYVHVGRTLRVVATGNANITAAGTYYVHVSHPLSGSVSVELVESASVQGNDEDNTYIEVAELVEDGSHRVHQLFGIHAYPIVYLYEG